MSNTRPYTITAHTGTMGTPDNSLESIETGIKNGADIVEIDLNFFGGIPVLSHNAPKGGEVLFEDALKVLAQDDTVKMNIDVKNTFDLKLVEELVIKYGLLDRVFFTGISKDFVPAVKEQCRSITYYLNLNQKIPLSGKKNHYEYVANLVKEHGAIGLNSFFACINKGLVDYLHSEGLLVSGWTANTETQMKNLIKKGVDNITTRRPDILRKL